MRKLHGVVRRIQGVLERVLRRAFNSDLLGGTT